MDFQRNTRGFTLPRAAGFIAGLFLVAGELGCSASEVTQVQEPPISVEVTVSEGVPQGFAVYQAELVADVRDSTGAQVDNAIVQWDMKPVGLFDEKDLITLRVTGPKTAEVTFLIAEAARVHVSARKGKHHSETELLLSARGRAP